MNSYMISGLLLIMSMLSGCCIQLLKSQTLNQSLGTFVPMNAAYVGSYTIQSRNSTIVNRTAIILFSDGSLVTTLLSESDDLIKTIQDTKRFQLYAGGSPFTWGKYYINADTIHIEHVENISPGGGCKMKSIRYNGIVKDGHLKIFPGPEIIYDNEGVTPFIYGKNGALLEYKGTVTNDLIDPSKAKFNR